MNTKPLTVLFLSTGNAARSILAEAILRHKASHRFNARSAGCRPLATIPPQTLALLAAEGIPADGLHPKGWGEFMAAARLVKVDVIVTLSEEARSGLGAWPGEGGQLHARHDSDEAPDPLQEQARRLVLGVDDAVPGPVRVHWQVDDPLSADNPDVMEWKFRKCFATLESRIASFVKNKAAQTPCELLLQLKDIGMVV